MEIDLNPLTKEEEQRLEAYEDFRVLRAEYPKRKGRYPLDYYRRLTLIKKKVDSLQKTHSILENIEKMPIEDLMQPVDEARLQF